MAKDNKCCKKSLYWKIIKSILVNNIECKVYALIAEAFGNYFTEVASNWEAEILQTSFDPSSVIPIKPESIFNPVSASECEKKILLKNRKKYTNTLTVRIFKTYADVLVLS